MSQIDTNQFQELMKTIKSNGELIKSSEKTLGEKISGLETKYDNALREQEERHKNEMQELRKELDEIRQLVEGKSDIVTLSNKAAESVVEKLATNQHKNLEKQVLVANEKANANEQYARNWCLRVYGVTIPKEDVAKVGHSRAAKEAVYNAVIFPIFNKLAEKGDTDLSEVSSAGAIIENCHAVGKEISKDGKVLPPPIIIRFMRRDIHDLIIRNRKLLPKDGAGRMSSSRLWRSLPHSTTAGSGLSSKTSVWTRSGPSRESSGSSSLMTP